MPTRRLFLTLLVLFLLIAATGCLSSKGGTDPEYSLSITVQPEGSGAVTTNPGGTVHKKGTTVTLTAAPSAGWAFHQWTGGVTGTANPTTIYMDADKNVTANFVKMKHTLTVNVVGEGTVTREIVATAGNTEYDYGTKVGLTAQPAAGWFFSRWEGDLTGNTNPAVIELDASKNVTAVFVEGGTVTGIITQGRMGPPVAGATVTVLHNGTELDSTITGAGGEYSLSVPAGGGVDLVAGKDGLAGTRFQGIIVAEGETFTADIIMQEFAYTGWSTVPPSVTVDGVSPGAALSGTVNIGVKLTGELDPRAVYIDIGAELPYKHMIETPPYSAAVDTGCYPDGDSFVHVAAYDQNNNCVITRIPVIINNHASGGPALVMTAPVCAYAITEGDNMHYDALEKLGHSIKLKDQRIFSRLQDSLSILTAEERSACYVLLYWEAEFSAESGFIGYNVYRSSAAGGPWRRLGTAYVGEFGDSYHILDTTPEVTPGVPSYYKVVPYSAGGVEGTGQTTSPVIPLGRFEVNLTAPEHNADGVALNPTLTWSHNGLAAGLYQYEFYLKELATDLPYPQAQKYLLTNNADETSVVYDTSWGGYYNLRNSRQYQWDIDYTVAYKTYDNYVLAVSIGCKGYVTGSYNGAFVFTTEPAGE